MSQTSRSDPKIKRCVYPVDLIHCFCKTSRLGGLLDTLSLTPARRTGETRHLYGAVLFRPIWGFLLRSGAKRWSATQIPAPAWAGVLQSCTTDTPDHHSPATSVILPLPLGTGGPAFGPEWKDLLTLGMSQTTLNDPRIIRCVYPVDLIHCFCKTYRLGIFWRRFP